MSRRCARLFRYCQVDLYSSWSSWLTCVFLCSKYVGISTSGKKTLFLLGVVKKVRLPSLFLGSMIWIFSVWWIPKRGIGSGYQVWETWRYSIPFVEDIDHWHYHYFENITVFEYGLKAFADGLTCFEWVQNVISSVCRYTFVPIIPK